LHLKVAYVRESIPNAIGVGFRSMGSLPMLISKPCVDFGGIIASPEGVSIALFSETLDSVVNHIVSHCSKTPGLTIKKIGGSSTTLNQSGLFKLEVLTVLRPDEFQAPSKKARLGRYDWGKLELVHAESNSVKARVDVSTQ